MKISDLDKNFKVEFSLEGENISWFDTKEEPFKVYGMCSYEKGDLFRRIPQAVAESVSDGVVKTGKCSAGGRIRFRTNSRRIAMKAELPKWGNMWHMTFVGSSGFDLYAYNNDGENRYMASLRPKEQKELYEALVTTDGEWRTYTINMPLYKPVIEVSIGLDADAEIEEPQPYTYEKPVLFYGSSITQGGCASRPGNAYVNMISNMLDCDVINLGFSGNAKGEKNMVDYLASLDASVFVCDYDHNAPNPEWLRDTLAPLYDTYRKERPDTPFIFVSRPDFYEHIQENVERREIVREAYERALALGDKNVDFVDGSKLFDGPFSDSCTVDGGHPNDLGFFRMAIGIGAAVEKWLCK